VKNAINLIQPNLSHKTAIGIVNIAIKKDVVLLLKLKYHY